MGWEKEDSSTLENLEPRNYTNTRSIRYHLEQRTERNGRSSAQQDKPRYLTVIEDANKQVVSDIFFRFDYIFSGT